MRTSEMDFDDMLKQVRMVKRMGSGGIPGAIRMIPGIGSVLPFDAIDRVNDKEVAKIEGIILSMTPAERRNPDLLDVSRRVRIAEGSGTSLRDVADLCGRLYDMRRNLRRRR